MKQVFLSGAGEVTVFDVPIPGRLRDSVLVRNAFSVISSGTEGSYVSGRGGLLGLYERARSSKGSAEKVWKLIETKGYKQAWDRIWDKIGDYDHMGYSCAGWVVESDNDRMPFKHGQPVACMGSGLANHAEYVVIPKNLFVPIPEGISLEEASFASLGCIALQGIRRLDPTPGERIGVLGLGLIGQICVRMLHALGHHAFGMDVSEQRAAKARETPGVQAWALDGTDSVTKVMDLTNGQGLDGVIVCAATSLSEPVNLAFDLCRKRGRVSMVGEVGLALEREKMYAKELELRMSCSYGPGRYDPEYELRGRDYPAAYVRWTERRNLEFFLDLMATGRLSLRSLVSVRYTPDEAPQAYARVKQADPDTYGVLFDYGRQPEEPAAEVLKIARTVRYPQPIKAISHGRIRLGLIGVGRHAKDVHVPNLKKMRDTFAIQGIASRSGATAGIAAIRHAAAIATSDHRELLASPDIDAVLIATRHTTHARFVKEALDAGKHVFVEKPMTLTLEDAQEIVEKSSEKGLIVRVGFNRRFSPWINATRNAIGTDGLRIFSSRVNTGIVAGDWSNTEEEGGRVLGEAVHFFDLSNWFMAAEPVSVLAMFAGEETVIDPDLMVQIKYPGGSAGQVLYTTLGSAQMGKEYFEAFGNGRAARSDDFRNFSSYGASQSVGWGERGNKGHAKELEEFAAAIRGEKFPIRGADARAGLVATWMALACYKSAKTGCEIKLDV
ncbi:MAG: Gfo/Idh/MocA family oxidoreductase [Desulfomonile tiedjei]|nr:Gfo/Idh/MocA family oxidoreductase [Desulfomonile tiedjei]